MKLIYLIDNISRVYLINIMSSKKNIASRASIALTNARIAAEESNIKESNNLRIDNTNFKNKIIQLEKEIDDIKKKYYESQEEITEYKNKLKEIDLTINRPLKKNRCE